MPYIKQDDRVDLDVYVEQLAALIKHIAAEGPPGAFAGLLNYTCTKLALRVIPERRYWAIALVSGVFHNIADEFYRRYAVPYEEIQKKDNGDVY